MTLRGLGVQVCNSHVPNTELYVSRSPSVFHTLAWNSAFLNFCTQQGYTERPKWRRTNVYIMSAKVRVPTQMCTELHCNWCVCVCVRLVQDRCGMVLCFRDKFCFRLKRFMSLQPPCTWHRSSRCSPSVVRTDRGAVVSCTEHRRL
jgi:hypothetical protein